jgi:hypothetical protein
MKYTAEMGSRGIIYIQGFLSSIEAFESSYYWGRGGERTARALSHTHTQDFISLLLFL